MARQGIPDLGQFLTTFALATVESQREYDRQYLAEIVAASQTGSPLLQALIAMQPRMRIQQNTVSARFLVRKGKATGFSIGVQDLNLRFHTAHRTVQETESSLELVIEQVPAPNIART